jgi:soluble lytic murein transglycosylase-like protein
MDLRVLSQLLKLQIQNGGSLFPSSSDASTTSGVDFSALLAQVMMNGTSTPAAMNTAANAISTTVPDSQPVMLGKLSAAHSTRIHSGAFDPLIEQAGNRFSVDSDLIRSVIRTESSFNPYAVSSAGAKGLMQLMDGTARMLGVSDSFDPQQNIEGGTQYLADMLKRYNGHIKPALAAYNAGPGRVEQAGIRTDADFEAKQHLLPSETQKYVPKVMDAWMNLKGY